MGGSSRQVDPVVRILELLEDKEPCRARCPSCRREAGVVISYPSAPEGNFTLRLHCDYGCDRPEIRGALQRTASLAPSPVDEELFAPLPEPSLDVSGARAGRPETGPETGDGHSARVPGSVAPCTRVESAEPGQRTCPGCGRDFLVNPSRAQAHKCCSPACRARHYRRTRTATQVAGERQRRTRRVDRR